LAVYLYGGKQIAAFQCGSQGQIEHGGYDDSHNGIDQGSDGAHLCPDGCHILRHTFTTRMCEMGVNIKVIQDVLGHADVSTTLNIYADATKDLKKSEFALLEAKML